LEQEAIDEETNHLRRLEQTKQQVVRDKQGRLQAEIDAVTVSEEERKEVCTQYKHIKPLFMNSIQFNAPVCISHTYDILCLICRSYASMVLN